MKKMMYHLTKQKYVDKILKEGLKPMIGDNSKIVEEKEPLVYMCDEESIPYWKVLLGLDSVISVKKKYLDSEALKDYNYYPYHEFTYPKEIPAEALSITKEPEVDNEQKKALIWCIINSISKTCCDWARYYFNPYEENDDVLEEDVKNNECFTKILISALGRIDFGAVTKKEIKEYLKSRSEQGHFTFLDFCDMSDKEKTCRLYQKLIKYPDDAYSEVRKSFYKTIKNIFSGCLNIHTGGWLY